MSEFQEEKQMHPEALEKVAIEYLLGLRSFTLHFAVGGQSEFLIFPDKTDGSDTYTDYEQNGMKLPNVERTITLADSSNCVNADEVREIVQKIRELGQSYAQTLQYLAGQLVWVLTSIDAEGFTLTLLSYKEVDSSNKKTRVVQEEQAVADLAENPYCQNRDAVRQLLRIIAAHHKLIRG